jgi:hypothetical protein
MAIDWVWRAAGEHIIASPHPAVGWRTVRRLCPGGWSVWRGRTFELLRQGPPTLIQHSSGVSLEALLIGIPTIELSLPGRDTNYSVLNPEHVRFASSPAGLARELEAAHQDAVDEIRREQLVTWARRWCVADGRSAAAAAWSLIERSAEEGPGVAPIFDFWSAQTSGGVMSHVAG